MKRRNFILLLGGGGSAALSTGTGAFSSASAERNVSVNVEDDENAFIRYETPNDGTQTEYGERVTLVRVRNQFGGSQDLALVGVEYQDDNALRDVTVERYDGSAAPDEELDDADFTDVNEDHVAIERGSVNGDYPAANEDDAFGPGEWVRIVADAYVPPGESVSVEVTIALRGVDGGVSAQLFADDDGGGHTRSFALHSDENNPNDIVDGVKFPGQNKKVQIETKDGVGGNQTVIAAAYYLTGGTVKRTGEERVKTSGNLKLGDFDVSESGSIVGLDILGIEGVFDHPNFDESDCELPSASGNPGGPSTGPRTEDEAFGDCLESN